MALKCLTVIIASTFGSVSNFNYIFKSLITALVLLFHFHGYTSRKGNRVAFNHLSHTFKFSWCTATGFNNVIIATFQDTSCFSVGSVRIAVEHIKGSSCTVGRIRIF